ncbi:septum formation family protein [Subtercola boreus]|nr:septum formation family protein [Subtercola boreus]TQL53453.1 putative regulator of septum formation [Subtercola boreus]
MATQLHRSSALLAVAGALSAVLVLTGCSAGTSDSPLATGAATAPASPGSSVDPSTPHPAETVTADVFSLKVGDCLDNTSDTSVSEVPTIDCAAPHDLEVFYDYALADSVTYPGTGALQQSAEESCKSQFAAFVGVGYDLSILAFTEYVPTETSWAGGDRTVTCVLGDPNAKSIGSQRGTAH